MKILRLIFLIFFFSINKIFAQNITINLGLDTIDVERKTVVQIWPDYLHSKPDSLYDNPYWKKSEKQQYKSYDLLKSEGFISPSLYYYNLDNKILSLSKINNGIVIKSIFYARKSGNIFAITNVLATKIDNKYYLSNYQPIYTSNWILKINGIIKYHYFPDYKFDSVKANEANLFLSNLCSAFDIKPDTINYFICRDCDDIYRVKGFDYVFSMGNGNECGYFDEFNNIVYATAYVGENHQHELTHSLNKYFPKAHGLLLAGISAYWGGEKAHNGKSLLYHVKRVNEYLQLHPEINLNEPTEFWKMDSETNPQYVIGAILCDKALREGGFDKLKKILNSGDSDKELKIMIEDELKIKKDMINLYLRNRISEIAKMDEFKIIKASH